LYCNGTTVDDECSAQRHGSDNETNYIKAYDKEGNTALHLAVQNGSIEVSCVIPAVKPVAHGEIKLK